MTIDLTTRAKAAGAAAYDGAKQYAKTISKTNPISIMIDTCNQHYEDYKQKRMMCANAPVLYKENGDLEFIEDGGYGVYLAFTGVVTLPIAAGEVVYNNVKSLVKNHPIIRAGKAFFNK